MVFGLGKKSKKTEEKPVAIKTGDVSLLPEEKKGIFKRLRGGLSKTRHKLGDGMNELLLGKKTLDEDILEALETILISSDVGLSATADFLEQLRKQTVRKQRSDDRALLDGLKEIMLGALQKAEAPLEIDPAHRPFVIEMVGVNGSGKTTTTGKLAKQFQQSGKKVMLAAADTFRAAAVEQLQVWGERNDVPVIAQHSGADSAAVCFDALSSAKAKNMDVLVVDTAGRLHTQDHLMAELVKVKRVIAKVDETAPHEVLLVLDASIGQNALQQAKMFHQAVGVTGICITKLDGTAKAGVIFAIVKELGLPVRYIGVGEQIDDLQPFQAQAFVDALFEG